MRCPICSVVIQDDAPQKPFCSERCRLIDLGGWLDGKYRIAGERNVDEASSDENDRDKS